MFFYIISDYGRAAKLISVPDGQRIRHCLQYVTS